MSPSQQYERNIAMSNVKNAIDTLQKHYEELPYPHREPEDEKKRVVCTDKDVLAAINHFCFQGKKDFNNSRMLVAGAGTGDATIYLAEQLQQFDNCELIYLDLSSASMAVAKERAKMRGLNNIKWIQGSLLDLPTMDIGKFDYINCCGVLHHLPDPDEGLRALASVLQDDGAIGIMVYAKYGRLAVYPLQEMMRMINSDTDDVQEKIRRAKVAIDSLPKNHWFFQSPNVIRDEVKKGDQHIYDILLHSCDRSYSVPEIFDFAESAGLCVGDFSGMQQIFGKMTYDPAVYVKDPKMVESFKEKSLKDRLSISEILHGHLFKHSVYFHFTPLNIPELFGEDMSFIPSYSPAVFPEEKNKDAFLQGILNVKVGEKVAINVNQSKASFVKSKYLDDIIANIDGTKTVKEIFDTILNKHEKDDRDACFEQIKSDLTNYYNILHNYQMMFLRDKSLPPFQYSFEMQKRVKKMYEEESTNAKATA